MGDIGESRYYDKRELTQKLHDADVRTQVLLLALRQIAEHPGDDADALRQLAKNGLQQAAKAESSTPVTSS